MLALQLLLTVASALSLVSSPRSSARRISGAGPAPDTITEAELVRRLKSRADSLTARDQFSGVILLTRAGRTVFEGAYGYADREAKRRNVAGTAFNYSSIGKLFTATAIWQLVEAGKLAPDSTVGKYLRDYPNADVARTVTIRQLLQHRSGVGGDIFATPVSGKRGDVRSTKDYLALIANAPMHFAAGAKQEYSNAGYIILGALIERVSGEDYYSYVRKHVLEPAGLRHSGWYLYDSLPPMAAIGYTRNPGGNADPAPDAPLRRNSETIPGRGSSAGGGYSTVEDLERFVLALRESKIPGSKNVQHGAIAGGSPGSNGIVEEDLPGSYDVVVLSNFDPPAAMSMSLAVRNWLTGKPADTPRDQRAVVAATSAPGSTAATAPVDLSRTEAGRVLDRYLRAFNSGDEATMRAFFEGWVVPSKDRTIEQRLERYRDMRGDLGRMTPASLTSASDKSITLVLHAEKGGDVTLTITVEEAPPHRIVSIQIERD
ncbi:MAG: beta-lactamase family protein [Gemmatimonadota bacterium]|nr:beta-lactamase family protein [Gemmatimonadota bacterium]